MMTTENGKIYVKPQLDIFEANDVLLLSGTEPTGFDNDGIWGKDW